ncbi:MAG: serine/threonine-protein kinase [bacterium]
MNDDRLLDLALLLADGHALPAPSADGPEVDPRLLESLRLLADVAAVHAGPAIGERFELLERLGRGSGGDVHRAYDRQLDRFVAVKHVQAQSPRGAGRDALEEARRLAAVRHPNVVIVHGVERVDGRDAIVLEYVRGRTLRAIVNDSGPLPPDEIRRIGADLAHAVAAVHAAGLRHQDLKPDNVMIEDGGRVVLMDFAPGSATPLCAAPELLAGHPGTERADVWGIGVVLFHLATGEYPFVARTRQELADAHAAGATRTVASLRADLPRDLADVIDHALRMDPSRRPRSATEIAHRLERDRRPRTSPVPWIAALTLAGLVVWVALRFREPGPDPDLFGPTTPWSVSAAFHRGPVTGDVLHADDRITVGDSLSLSYAASESTWVYVMNEDERGEAYLLFPLPGLDARNPLPPGTTHALPGASGGHPIGWRVTSPGDREHLLVVASRKRLDALEARLLDLERATGDRLPTFPRLDEAARDALRGVGGLTRPTQAGGGRASALARFAEPWPDSSETVTGPWIRQLELRNADR